MTLQGMEKVKEQSELNCQIGDTSSISVKFSYTVG